MAAARVGNFKLIRVDKLPSVMYNLVDDLGETDNLSTRDQKDFQELNTELENWEKETIAPLWTEGAAWDTVTWMIHQDLMLNRPVRAKDPGQLKKDKQNHK
jgi:hypothetical protein